MAFAWGEVVELFMLANELIFKRAAPLLKVYTGCTTAPWTWNQALTSGNLRIFAASRSYDSHRNRVRTCQIIEVSPDISQTFGDCWMGDDIAGVHDGFWYVGGALVLHLCDAWLSLTPLVDASGLRTMRKWQ